MLCVITLKKNELKLLQFTDIHIGQTPFSEEDQKTFAMIDRTLSKSDADLIVITGDLIWSDGVIEPTKGLEALAEIFNKYPIPLAITYGNHDSEESLTRHDLHDLEKKLFHNLAVKTNQFLDPNQKECFTIEVKDKDEIVNVLYFIDSGANALIDYESYDWVSLEQIQWYDETFANYQTIKPTKDLLFLHIPLPEYQQAGDRIVDGKFWEMNPRISAPKLNTGLFSHLLKNNHLLGTFCGHDHDNNFEGIYLDQRLIYGNVTGYNCYGDLPRGYRVIYLKCDQMKTSIKTFE
ncbi:metallophosphoesterase family protein [Enterococcus sp. MJM12]|uniref:Metallophosphoesterase family protein n=1 Tax=Candidatus Enterococcus myersii TaxID=2815322 RepID=A0ABS3H5T1_9ENTE|nr:metallophosphoesterase family protein [Enterococcus sp. MJM12]MBO0448412.1 metallophosphoesterase family protein [Enterococcus sp. MJM12]